MTQSFEEGESGQQQGFKAVPMAQRPVLSYGALFGRRRGVRCGEIAAKLLHGAGAVGELVFHVRPQFGKSLSHTFGFKHRVVAETARTAGCGGDATFHFAFKEMLLSLLY